jgi:hypothetical protein
MVIPLRFMGLVVLGRLKLSHVMKRITVMKCVLVAEAEVSQIFSSKLLLHSFLFAVASYFKFELTDDNRKRITDYSIICLSHLYFSLLFLWF